MPLTERELRAIQDIEARLEASSPDLAQVLARSRPMRAVDRPGRDEAAIRGRQGRAAASLAMLVLAVALTAVAGSVGIGVALAVALLVTEAAVVMAVAHGTGRAARSQRPQLTRRSKRFR